jgi:hypothetical protein
MKYVKATAGCIYGMVRINRHSIGKNLYTDDVFMAVLMFLVFGTMWLSLIQL